MTNPNLPGVPQSEQIILYDKLKQYNSNRISFKEGGVYLVVLPHASNPNYSLWAYSPLIEKGKILFICDLSFNISIAMRMASMMFYYSKLGIAITDYNEKRMQSNGDDLIAFGKYHGHFLYEILKIDPAYLSWIAYKYIPKIPKQERFVMIAQVYHQVHLDMMLRKIKEREYTSQFLGKVGEKLRDLRLKVKKVRLADNPYKTAYEGSVAKFYVIQYLQLTDRLGNKITTNFYSKNASYVSGTLSPFEHAYRQGEILFIDSAIIARTYENYGVKYTKLYHIKLKLI
ncbi:MAG: hypothetical protein M0P00_06270 [Bacteroidaceae bacterium]|nr:hypothetical protein [Bacteroidaceae bacterium]